MKIITSYVHPPIPIRNNDWCAYIDGQEEAGPYGRGETEEGARADLLEQLEEKEGECGSTDYLRSFDQALKWIDGHFAGVRKN